MKALFLLITISLFSMSATSAPLSEMSETGEASHADESAPPEKRSSEISDQPAETSRPSPESRVWTDDQGRKVTARFVYVEEDLVILERDGRQFRWPLERLSEADQEFVHEILPLTLPPIDLGDGVVMAFVWIEDLGIWVGKYEVTNEEFRRFRPEHDSGYVTRNGRRFDLNTNRQPATLMSYDDAVAFTKWLNERSPLQGSARQARLLTGDEWTAIARCGEDREFPWGDSWPPTRGNYSDLTAREKLSWTGMADYRDGFAVAAPVDESGVNEWDLYGVGGNVFEWTSELRGTDRVLRGGNWGINSRSRLQIESRIERDPTRGERGWGFRVAVAPE